MSAILPQLLANQFNDAQSRKLDQVRYVHVLLEEIKNLQQEVDVANSRAAMPRIVARIRESGNGTTK